jgi:hypothetical protein
MSDNGTVIPGSLTAFPLVVGDQMFTGKSNTTTWWNPWQQREDGLIPWDEDGGVTAGDHYIKKDVKGSTWPTIAGNQELEDGATGRPTCDFDYSRLHLHVASISDNKVPEYWRATYDPVGDTYTVDIGSPRAGETITDMPVANNGSFTPGFVITPNGNVWICMLTTAGGLEFNMRTPGVGGSWNGTATQLDSTIEGGACCGSYFFDGTNWNAWFFAAENDSVAAAEWEAYYIDENHSNPFSGGNWSSDDTANWTRSDMDGGEADNQCACVRLPGERIGVVVKTGSITPGNTLIGLWERFPNGTYIAHNNISNYSATSSENRSRASIVCDTNGYVYILYNQETTADLPGWYIKAHHSNLSSWGPEIPLITRTGDSISDIRGTQHNYPRPPEAGIFVIGERMIGNSTPPGDDVLWAQIPVAESPLSAAGISVLK